MWEKFIPILILLITAILGGALVYCFIKIFEKLKED
jgi:hypothetical protein